MDTLKATQELERAGVPREQADAIVLLLRDLGAPPAKGASDVLTQHYLDIRLAKHTLLITAIFAVIVALAHPFG